MEKHALRTSSIYFHMGPGFHSRIEAQYFSASYPHVLFQDQPLDMSFTELVQWARETIEHTYHQNQKPVRLLGHSFGAQIINEVLPDVTDKVCDVRLLNSLVDPFDCFANLETALFPDSALGAEFWKSQPLSEKIKLILRLAQDPRFEAAYWNSSEAHQKYTSFSKDHPTLNIEAFFRVFTGRLEKGSPQKQNPWQGPVEIYYSTADRLIQSASCMDPWKGLFPQAKFIELSNVGHYALFESTDLAEKFLGN